MAFVEMNRPLDVHFDQLILVEAEGMKRPVLASVGPGARAKIQ